MKGPSSIVLCLAYGLGYLVVGTLIDGMVKKSSERKPNRPRKTDPEQAPELSYSARQRPEPEPGPVSTAWDFDGASAFDIEAGFDGGRDGCEGD